MATDKQLKHIVHIGDHVYIVRQLKLKQMEMLESMIDDMKLIDALLTFFGRLSKVFSGEQGADKESISAALEDEDIEAVAEVFKDFLHSALGNKTLRSFLSTILVPAKQQGEDYVEVWEQYTDDSIAETYELCAMLEADQIAEIVQHFFASNKHYLRGFLGYFAKAGEETPGEAGDQ